MQRLFGTNGVRGVVGELITAEFALRFGRAVGTFFGGGTLAVGTDTRTTGPMLTEALVAGLNVTSCDVVRVGTLPTPALQLYITAHGLTGGVAVTASHNPAEYNGFKIVNADGMDISRAEEEKVEALHAAGETAPGSWDHTGRVRAVQDAPHYYMNRVLATVDSEAIRRAAPHVVVDCANGAACGTTPTLLRRVGCRVLTLNGHPDGTFPGRHPEPREEHLGTLTRLVSETGAALGIAHDGDADRAVFIDDRGRYVHGDRALAVLARERLRDAPGVVVTPVSSSSAVEDVVIEAGGTIDYTAIGAPIVCRRMQKIGAVLGGEESGGLMFPELHHAKDGGMAAVQMVQLLVRSGRELSELVDALPPYLLVRRSIEIPPGTHDAVLAAIRERTSGEKTIQVDGVKVIRPEGRVLLRPSGTEPLFRIYAEAKERRDAAALADYAEDLIRTSLPPG